MTQPTYDQAFWEQLWTKTLHEHADKVGGGKHRSCSVGRDQGAAGPLHELGLRVSWDDEDEDGKEDDGRYEGTMSDQESSMPAPTATT